MREALIVWGGWAGHEPEQGAAIVADMLSEDGFSPLVTSDYAAFGAADIDRFDLVVPIITSDTIARPLVDNLSRAVRGGVGLAGYHGGLATSFPSEVRFHYITGVQWVQHPGDIIDYRVEVTRPDDPIMAGIASFDYRSEQYYLHYDPSIEILATTTFDGSHDPVVEGVIMPVAFKRRFGAGRVFYSALGHVAAEFADPNMRTILRRGLNWAARSRDGA
jgi:type 1 glutamine amidotransferase